MGVEVRAVPVERSYDSFKPHIVALSIFFIVFIVFSRSRDSHLNDEASPYYVLGFIASHRNETDLDFSLWNDVLSRLLDFVGCIALSFVIVEFTHHTPTVCHSDEYDASLSVPET